MGIVRGDVSRDRHLQGRVRVVLDGQDVTARCRAFDAEAGWVELRDWSRRRQRTGGPPVARRVEGAVVVEDLRPARLIAGKEGG